MSHIPSRKMGFLEKMATIMHDEAGGSTTIGVLLKVQGQLSFDEFKVAWHVLFQRHPLLRATCRIEGQDYFFDFNANWNDIVLKHVQAKTAEVASQEYSNEVAKAMKTDRYMWRSTLVTESETCFYLLFGGIHTICDARSISWLLGDLLRIVIELRQGKTPQVESYPIPAAFDDIMDRQRFSPTDIPPEAEILAFQNPATIENSYSLDILHELTETESTKLLQLCRQNHVTVTSALAAVLASVIFQAKLTTRDHVNLFTAFDMRPYAVHPVPQRVLDFYAHMVPFKMVQSKAISFGDLAKQALSGYQQGIREYRLFSATDEAVFAAIREGVSANFKAQQFFAPYCITNAGVLDNAFVDISPDFQAEAFYFNVMNRGLFGFLLLVTSVNSKICLDLNFTTPAFSQETARNLAEHFMRSLRQIIT